MSKNGKEPTKQKDYSETVNVLALIVLVVVFVGVYFAGANGGGFKKVVIKTEKAYVEKTENIKNVKKSLKKKEVEKVKIPYDKYSFTYNYILDVKGNAKSITFKVAVPKDENQKQYISQLNLSPQPAKTYNDGVNNIAEFKFNDVSNRKLNIVISGIANQRTYDYQIAQAFNRNPHKESDLTQYLKPAPYIESDDAQIVKTALSLKGNTTKETVENVFDFLQKNMKYNINAPTKGAKDVLARKQGKCVDYANLMVALLRANKIPARYVVGYMIKEGYSYHAWVEVYYTKYGWVAYDPTISAMASSYKDAQGNNHKYVAKIDPSKSLGRRYIASARNKISAYQVAYEMIGKNKAKVSLSENVKIKKFDE